MSLQRFCFVAVLVLLPFFIPTAANATTVQAFEAMPQVAQATLVADFIQKMTRDIGQQNPALAEKIRTYFVRRQPGKPFSEGMEKLEIELAAINHAAKQGSADPTRIQVEGVIVTIAKRQF